MAIAFFSKMCTLTKNGKNAALSSQFSKLNRIFSQNSGAKDVNKDALWSYCCIFVILYLMILKLAENHEPIGQQIWDTYDVVC